MILIGSIPAMINKVTQVILRNTVTVGTNKFILITWKIGA